MKAKRNMLCICKALKWSPWCPGKEIMLSLREINLSNNYISGLYEIPMKSTCTVRTPLKAESVL